MLTCLMFVLFIQATKQMTIHDAPMVLVLHLKRFAFGSFSGKASKHIKFNQFLELPVSNETKGKTDGNKASEQHANKGHKNAGMRNTESYELCGMIVHHGSSVHSGHYVAYIKVCTLKYLRTLKYIPQFAMRYYNGFWLCLLILWLIIYIFIYFFTMFVNVGSEWPVARDE